MKASLRSGFTLVKQVPAELEDIIIIKREIDILIYSTKNNSSSSLVEQWHEQHACKI